jgi:hypothetical protein
MDDLFAQPHLLMLYIEQFLINLEAVKAIQEQKKFANRLNSHLYAKAVRAADAAGAREGIRDSSSNQTRLDEWSGG